MVIVGIGRRGATPNFLPLEPVEFLYAVCGLVKEVRQNPVTLAEDTLVSNKSEGLWQID